MNKIFTTAILLTLFATDALAEWTYQENIDAMTDVDKSMAVNIAGRNELVAVRCNGTDSFDVLVGVGEYIGSDTARVTYRFDQNDPVYAGPWSLSTTGSVVFAPSSEREELLNQFKSGNTVIFQITDFRGSKPTSSFSLSGSSKAIDQLSCVN